MSFIIDSRLCVWIANHITLIYMHKNVSMRKREGNMSSLSLSVCVCVYARLIAQKGFTCQAISDISHCSISSKHTLMHIRNYSAARISVNRILSGTSFAIYMRMASLSALTLCYGACFASSTYRSAAMPSKSCVKQIPRTAHRREKGAQWKKIGTEV